MAQCATTALAGAVPRPSVRGARGRFGGLGPVPGVVSLPFPPSRPACPALRVAGCPVRVSLTLARWYAIPRGLCVPRARSGCPSGSPRVPSACVCAGAPAASALPPPWMVWRAHLPQSRHWALVGPFHVVRAPPCVLPRSLAPSGVLGGGRSGPGSPLPGLGLCAPRGAGPWRSCAGGRVFGGGWGGPCAMPPVCAAGGASRAGGCSASFRPSAFPGQATKRVSLASFWSWAAWSPYHSGSCSPTFSGRDLCGVLARWRGLACSPRFLWRPAARAGGRAVLRLLSRAGGGGTIPPASGGGGRRPRGLRASGGGGVAPRPPCSPSGGRPAVPYPGPPLVIGAVPPGVRVRSGLRGRPWGGGMRGGPWTAPPGAPSDLKPPLCPPRVGNGHGGGHRGRGLHTVLVRRRAPPPGLVRAPLRRAGVGSPVGHDPRGSRRLGALGRAVCGFSRTPPPRVAFPAGGGGASPRLRGGGGSLLWPSSWGGERGGGVGRGAAPPPPAPPPLGHRPAIRSLRRAPPGYTRAVGVAGRPRASGTARSAANGSVRRGGGGGGGGSPPALVCAPAFPRAASEGAAPFAPSWAPPVRRRSAAGRAGACWRSTGGGLPRPRCPLTLVGAAFLGGVRGRRPFGLPPSTLGPEGEGGGSGGGPLVPWRRPLTAEGGRPGGPGPGGQPFAWGVALSPRPPLPTAGPSCRPSLGPLVPPAVAARRWPAMGGREG